MAFVLADRVKESCSAPGTGTVTLLGAATGYQAFSAGIGANNTTYYTIADQGGTNWEVGYGTIGAGGTTLARTTVLASSNSGSLVDFSSGSQDVFCDYPATTAVYTDTAGSISEPIVNISSISGAITTPDSITFDITPETVPTAQGSLYWDSADSAQTLSLVMEGGNAIQQIGEETYFRIKCSSAVTEGQVVMFTGTVGSSGGLTGAPATGLTASTASYVMGVATESGALNDWIYVTAFGLVRNIDTTGGAEAWVDGQILYYDPTVTGGLTKTLPAAPNAKVQVCAVVHAASNGSLFIRPAFGGALGQYEGDVQITTPADGQLLIRNQTDGKWVNATLTDGTGISITEGAGSVTITNTAPDQTVSITAGTGISVSGTYPSFTVTNTLPDTPFTYTTSYIPYGQGTTTPNESSSLTFASSTLTAPIVSASNGLVVNSNTVSASYSIPSGSSASSVGPMTVASGQSVTVPSGSRWVVL